MRRGVEEEVELGSASGSGCSEAARGPIEQREKHEEGNATRTGAQGHEALIAKTKRTDKTHSRRRPWC